MAVTINWSTLFAILAILHFQRIVFAKDGFCTRSDSTEKTKFSCPELGQRADWTLCCGSEHDIQGQYCCNGTAAESRENLTGIALARGVRSVEKSNDFKRKVKKGKKKKEKFFYKKFNQIETAGESVNGFVNDAVAPFNGFYELFKATDEEHPKTIPLPNITGLASIKMPSTKIMSLLFLALSCLYRLLYC